MASMSRGEQIVKIQELCFACVDLNLYLDNHPEDKNAVCLYNSACPFQWVDDPWPWQKEYYE